MIFLAALPEPIPEPQRSSSSRRGSSNRRGGTSTRYFFIIKFCSHIFSSGSSRATGRRTRGWRGWPRVPQSRMSPTHSSTRARGAAPAPTTGSSARTLVTSCWEPSRGGPGAPSSITLLVMADNVLVNIGNVMISWCENKLETKEIKFIAGNVSCEKFCIYLFLSSLLRIPIMV